MSLRTRLLLLVALATLVPAIFLGVRFFQNRAADIESALAALSLQANNIAADLDGKIQGTAQLHFGLARAVDLGGSRARCSAFLAAVREEYPQYTGILTISSEGKLVCDSLQTGRDLDLKDRPYFQRALMTRDAVTIQPGFGRLTGTSVLQIAYPVRMVTGDLKFVLLASLNLQSFVEFHSRRLPHGLDILLLDKDGTVLVSPSGPEWTERLGSSIANTNLYRLAAGQPEGRAREIVGIDGGKQFWAAAATPAVRDAGLYVMVGIPKGSLVAAADRLLYQGLAVVALVSLLLFAGVWGLAERGVRRPVGRIAAMVKRLAAGDLSARIALPFPAGELGQLMGKLNVAAGSLEHKHAEQHRSQQLIAHMAHYDTLTDLPNRAAFNACFAATLVKSAAKGAHFTILSMDLNRFKEANDVYGHATGDALLQEAARRLHAAACGSFIARIGGDEFTVIVTDGAQPHAAAAVAERLLAAFVDYFVIDGKRIQVGLSIGGAVYPAHGTDAKTLMINADAALYRAKAEQRTSALFFEPEMAAQLQERHELQRDLRLAIDGGALSLHYQPQFRLTGEVVGMEALARWTCPKRGVVPPAKFIPVAEEYGLIIPLGAWALREACHEAASWPQPLTIAVNVSPIQFHHGDLPSLVHSILLQTGLAPSRLELEITEGVLINDFSRAISILCRLKTLGVQIALDDFGKGYSSLSYLHSFAFDKIKIDRAFVSDLGQNRHSMAIVRAVIGLGHSLKIPVLAEGVETQSQRALLAQEGCDQMQGYLIGRPFPIDDYASLVGRQPKLREHQILSSA